MHRPTVLALAACAATAWSCASAPARGTAADVATSDSTQIVVAATTDVHGRLRGWDYFADAPDTLRGLSRAATIVDSARRANPGHLVLVDAGDLLQGNPLTYVAARVDSSGPHPVIAAMNAMHYDAAAVGNHEFNYGLPHLMRAIGQASFPFLAANAYRPDGSRAFPASRLVERSGVRIAIVGATNPGSMVWDRDNLAGKLEIRDIVTDVAREVRAVRGRSDAVVVVIHSGLGERSSYDTVSTGLPSENVGARIAREVPGVNLVVIGHSHREIADTVINGVTIVQPRNWATSVALATLSMARRGGKWHVASTTGVVVREAGHVEDPAVLAATQRAHDATVRWVNQTLGTTPVAWRADSARVKDAPLIDFMLEVERRAAGTDLASTAAFDIGASLDAGPITVAEVARLYPYDNTLRAVRITGKQLRAYLEFSARYFRTAGTPEAEQSPLDPTIPGYNFDIVAGADYTLDISKPIGSRVTRLTVKGVPVKDDDVFTMALNNYRQTGGGGYAMLSGAPVVYDHQEEIRDLLIAEVRRRGTLRPEDFAIRNWELVPADAAAAAYRAMQGPGFDAVAPASADRRDDHLRTGRWIRIIGTNDFHGVYEPRVDSNGVARGGAPQLATAIARARAGCVAPACRSIWLDGGDEFQGTPASNMTFGASVVTLFSRLGLSASALGNHEFDWGIDSLRARMRQAPYAILSANVRDTTGKIPAWLRPDTLIDLGGTTIGVIGVSTVKTPTTTKPANVAALRFLDPAPVVDERARSLRARGADLVVVIAHAGAFCNKDDGTCSGEIVDLAQRVTEKIDAIVSGHTHSPVTTRVKGIPIVQSWWAGSAVGIIDLPIAGGSAPAPALRNVRVDSIPADPAIKAYTDSVLASTAAAFAAPVATIAERMERGPTGTLGNLIADAQRWGGKGDVAVMNRGGVRTTLNAGVATLGSLFEIQPFGNALVSVRMTGTQLRTYLERIVAKPEGSFHLSGMRLRVDFSRPAGRRIVDARFTDGRALLPRGTYHIIMTDFLAAGGDDLGITDPAESVRELDIIDRDGLAGYLRSLPSPVRAPTDARIIPVQP